MPTTAKRAADGSQVPLQDLRQGDRIALRAGEQCAVAGVVVSGTAVVSEAAVTGEHTPRTVGARAQVLAASLVLHGYAEVELTGPVSDSAFERVAKLVAQAQAQWPRVQAAVDRFARWWTPAVIMGHSQDPAARPTTSKIAILRRHPARFPCTIRRHPFRDTDEHESSRKVRSL